ncbi:enoyl-CoA hydratase-related protein (plasmid) [Sphingobium sp. JS3065]|uniref:enoyl-CoA hydratase-related protein n=1 Tax=Sphingobium sp. JS3065 TaxID=2970925 RepID=UPI0022654D13|nr:enoyl-CoA hydratase-related protein [Sphingobium sp. JS3065]UZW58287.1 enoyl-CoA hydratase-related protein [Sphingobium sp. JS3065]
MQFQCIALEQHGPLGVVRLNQPDTLNALSERMADELAAAIEHVEQTSRAMILTGAGRAFCSGANLAIDPAQLDSLDFGLMLETQVNPLMQRLRELPIPWISAVRGAAAGVGCSLALAADLIVASESAYFLLAFSRIGLVPDGGASHLLARTVGRPRAMEMALLAERISAAQALTWGMVNRVVPDDVLDATAIELAERLATGPTSLCQTRRMIWDAVDYDWKRMLADERREQSIAGASADAAEGIAAFAGKRQAEFRGA